MRINESLIIEEKVLEVIEEQLNIAIQKSDILNVDTQIIFDHLLNRYVAQFRRKVAMEKLDKIEVKYPADWLEAFKERWFPKYLLKKYPVKYKTETMLAEAYYDKVFIPKYEHRIVFSKVK